MTAAPKHLRPHSSCTSSRIDVINCDRFLRSAKFNEYRSSHKMWLSADTDLRPIDRSIPNSNKTRAVLQMDYYGAIFRERKRHFSRVNFSRISSNDIYNNNNQCSKCKLIIWYNSHCNALCVHLFKKYQHAIPSVIFLQLHCCNLPSNLRNLSLILLVFHLRTFHINNSRK